MATYSPVLKARDAEIKVLTASPHNRLITPIFELQNAPPATIDRDTGMVRRAKSTATDVSYFLDDIARQWQRFMYVDVDRVAGVSGKGSWWRLLSVLSELVTGVGPIAPVLHLGDPASDSVEAASLAAAAGKAAVRIRLPHANIASLQPELSAVATSLGLEPENIDVILDWEDRMEEHKAEDLEAGTLAVIGSIGVRRGSLISVGTPNTKHCVQVGDWEIARREWNLWRQLNAAGVDVTYGDYALYQPQDPVPVTPRYGHLRYSYNDKLWVHRRSIPAKTNASGAKPNLAGAFSLCCEHLIQSNHFYGAAFSTGDARIAEAAAGRESVGQAAVWREIALDHHLAVVAMQLGDPSEAPSAAA